jgi:hypothetical protein
MAKLAEAQELRAADKKKMDAVSLGLRGVGGGIAGLVQFVAGVVVGVVSLLVLKLLTQLQWLLQACPGFLDCIL